MRRKVAALVAAASFVLGAIALGSPPAAAASYTFSACQQVGAGQPPAGLDQLTLEVTGVAPVSVPRGATFDVSVSVVLANPSPAPITGAVIGLTATIPPGSAAFQAGFPSPTPFVIPASGTVQFDGSLQYVATGSPGTVLEFRPSVVSFGFGPDLGVNCTVAPAGPGFASTVIEDVPGYQYTCSIPSLGLTIQQTVDVVGTAPATAPMGSRFALADVITTGTPPVTITVDSSTFSLAPPPNATPRSSLNVTTTGPFTLEGGQPFSGEPMSFDFLASGPVGAVIEFRPGPITTEVAEYGAVSCALDPGQPPFASTTIAAPLDSIGIKVFRPNGRVVYRGRAGLTSGDFVFTRDADGRLKKLTGSGTFSGLDGPAALAVRYHRPWTSLRLRVPGADLDLRAASRVPLISRAHSPTALGLAFGRIDGRPVIVVWFVRDIA